MHCMQSSVQFTAYNYELNSCSWNEEDCNQHYRNNSILLVYTLCREGRSKQDSGPEHTCLDELQEYTVQHA